jgi:hypothetical protein
LCSKSFNSNSSGVYSIETTNHLFNTKIILYYLNALDKSKRQQTSWCQDCDKVFDNNIDAEIHKENSNHKIKIVEFWTISR